MTVSFLRTRTLSAAGSLDRRLHTSQRAPTDTFKGQARAKPARDSFHACKLLSVVRLSSSQCAQPHPCLVTAAHHPHTRPPDIPASLVYQRSLVNTYLTSDLADQSWLDTDLAVLLPSPEAGLVLTQKRGWC